MPFTISHVAAVLPFRRPLARWRVLSAIIVGSMVPDFGFLLPSQPDRFETHSIFGLYTFCLPVGIASWWLFQRLIRPAVVELLPDGAYARARAAPPLDLAFVAPWLLAAAAVFAGAVTHLVWDGFTHEGARGVRMIPALDDPVADIAGHHLLGFKFLQLGSSLVGLIIVVWFAWRDLRAPTLLPTPPRLLATARRRRWLSGYACVTLGASGLFFVLQHRWEIVHHHAVRALANGIAVAGLRGLAFALIAVSACLLVRVKGMA